MATKKDTKKKKTPVNPLALAVQQATKAAETAKTNQAKSTAKAATNPVSAATKAASTAAKTVKKTTSKQNAQTKSAQTMAARKAEGKSIANPAINKDNLNPLQQAKVQALSGITAKDKVDIARTTGLATGDKKAASQQKVENYHAARTKKEELAKAKLSYHDKRLSPGSKQIVQQAKLDYDAAKAAGDIEAMADAHAKAERQRAWAGYSGGAAGDEYLSHKLSREDTNRLNKAGEQALKKAKLDYEKAKEAGNTEAMAKAAAQGEAIRNSRGYLDSPGLERTGGNDQPMEYTSQAEKDRWAKQTSAAIKAGGTGIVGSLLSARETANQAYQNYLRTRDGTRLQNLANNRAAIEARLNLVRRGEGNPEWGTEQELEALLYQAEQAEKKLQAPTIVDPNLPGQKLMEQSQQYTKEALQGKTGFDKLLTQAGISILQNAPSMGLAFIPGVGPALGAGLMGAQAAGSKAYDLTQQGVDPQEAFTRGLISGGIETITERLPINNMLKIVRGQGGDDILKTIAKQAGIEATEESAAYISNLLADKAAQDPNAKWSWNDLAEAAAVGAISGVGFGAGGSVVNTALTSRARSRTGNPLLDTIRDAQGQNEEVVISENETTTPEARREALLQREQAYADRSADFFRRLEQATPAQQTQMLQEFEQLQQEERAIRAERSRLNVQEEQAPQPAPIQEQGTQEQEPEQVPENHIDRRTPQDVGSRQVNSFQFDNPQLRPYFKQAAQALIEDAEYSNSTQQARRGEGTVVRRSDALEQAESFGLSRNQIIKVCQDIIADHGQENYAAAKRVELVLDRMLSEGYVPNQALGNPDARVPANQQYISAKEQIPGAVRQDSFERYLQDNALPLELGEVTEEQLREEWSRRNDEDGHIIQPEDEVHAVGAAGRQFDPYTHALNDYGAIPPGENPARIIDVPRSTNGEDQVRRFARTALEAEITNPETIERLEQDIIDGGFSYSVRKDKASLDRAVKTIEEDGAMGALRQWMQVVDGKRQANKDDMVLAQLLYVNAERSGDTNLAAQLAAQIAAEGTVAGQNVQALRLLKQATPEGRIYYMRKIVGKINEDLVKGKRIDQLVDAAQVQLNDELVQDYLQAENEEQQTDALNRIYDDVVRQMPRTAGDVLTAWRYFAMLGNPRTHIRNILGNVVFGSIRNLSNEVSSVLQRTIKQENRTRAVASTRAARELAQQDYLEMKDALSGTKYNSDMDEIRKRLQDRALGLFSFLSKGNSWLLSAEDNVFKKFEYTRSLASYITAKGWDPANLSRPQLQAARTHAMQDALEATFQEANVVATKLAELERMNKVTKVAIGGAFPFKGVPTNIAKQGFRYSPAGLLKSITSDAAKVRSGEMDAAQMIDNLSAGLTGTGIAILGYWLSSMGFVNAGASDDDKERAIETAQGSQTYSLNLGNWSYTIDWAAPSVLPFFMGAEFQQMLKETEGDEEESTADKKLGMSLDALERMFEPLLNMTVLSGVSDALQSAAYSQSNPFTAVGGSIAQSFAGQVVPTLLGQVARTIDPIRRSTYTDKDSGIPTSIQQFLQTQQNKIPGLSQKNVPYLNVWGEESVIDNPLLRAMQNFVSPGYIAQRNQDGLMTELSRLHSLGYEGVVPSLRQKGQSVDLDKDGTAERLTRDQWEQWQKSQGTTAKTLLSNLLASQSYQDMSDDDKAASVKRIIDYSKETGKLDIGGSEEGVDNWVLNARQYAQDYGNGSPQTFFDAYNQRSAISKTNYNKGIQQGLVEDYINALPQSQEAKNYLLDTIKVFQQIPADSGNYNKAKAAGYTDPAEISALLSAKKAADTDENGSYTQAEIAALIKSQTSDPAEQKRLWNVYKQSTWKKTWSEVSSGSSTKKKSSSGSSKKSSKKKSITIY